MSVGGCSSFSNEVPSKPKSGSTKDTWGRGARSRSARSLHQEIRQRREVRIIREEAARLGRSLEIVRPGDPELVGSELENQPKRELNLAGGAGGLVDDPEAGSPNDVHGKTKIDEIEKVEKLGAKLQDCGLGVPAMTDARVLHQGEIQVVEIRAAEGVSSEGPEGPLVGTGAAGNSDGNLKEDSVVAALSEVIFPYRSAGRKDRSTDLVRAISTSRPHAGLLDAGVYAEGRTGGERGDIQDLPSRGDLLAQALQETGAAERQGLNQA